MNGDENRSVVIGSVKNMAGFLFLGWQDEDDKEGLTIFKNHHIDKSHNMTRIGPIILAVAHDLNNWTLLCWGESRWPEH